MTLTEKIANSKKRINELQRLINYWDNPEENNVNKINFGINNEKMAA